MVSIIHGHLKSHCNIARLLISKYISKYINNKLEWLLEKTLTFLHHRKVCRFFWKCFLIGACCFQFWSRCPPFDGSMSSLRLQVYKTVYFSIKYQSFCTLWSVDTCHYGTMISTTQYPCNWINSYFRTKQQTKHKCLCSSVGLIRFDGLIIAVGPCNLPMWSTRYILLNSKGS